jgi:hypothetical protein
LGGNINFDWYFLFLRKCSLNYLDLVLFDKVLIL